MNFNKLKDKWQKERESRAGISIIMKNTLSEKGRPVFERYKISKAVLFGSIHELKGTAGSDIDILVMPLPALHFWEFRHDIEEATGYSVDLYTDEDDPVFVKKVLERGEVIYEV